MLVLRTSNFQGATIRTTVTIHKRSIYCLPLNFLPRASSKFILNLDESRESQMYNLKKKTDKNPLKAGVHVKAVLRSVNTALLPISRSRFKRH